MQQTKLEVLRQSGFTYEDLNRFFSRFVGDFRVSVVYFVVIMCLFDCEVLRSLVVCRVLCETAKVFVTITCVSMWRCLY
jgi:hypothetical protein